MKKLILTITAITVIAFGTAKASNAAVKNDVSTTLTDISRISKIEIHGNVELYVSAGTTDKVKVYNKYYAENALVQNQNGVLRISSYGKQKLVVWVTANDLRGITAYDNSEVKSFGSLSVINLDVNLYDNAYAKLDMDAYSAKINLKDRSKADLTGNADECDLTYSKQSTLNSTNFSSGDLVKTVSLDSDKIKARQLVTL